jgi:hypothetical protein
VAGGSRLSTFAIGDNAILKIVVFTRTCSIAAVIACIFGRVQWKWARDGRLAPGSSTCSKRHLVTCASSSAYSSVPSHGPQSHYAPISIQTCSNLHTIIAVFKHV